VNTGIVFPGMGPAGYAELGKFMATDPGARRLRRTADDVLGYSLMDRYRDAGADYSEYSQVAFLICCLALSERADELAGSKPLACAGPSFGAKTAIAYSGALSFAETVLLTARLARCEEEYFLTEYQDVITQSVARTPWPALRDILGAMTDRSEWHDISCHIDQDFHMVSMRASSLDSFVREVRAAGGLPLYAMKPPMHSAAFAPLRRKAEEEVLGDFLFRDPGLPIITDQDGSAVRSAASARGMLLDGFVRPVRWPDVVHSMKNAGIVRIYISGPDSLFGRVRCTTQTLEVVPVNHKTARRTANYSMVLSSLRRPSMWDVQFEALLRSYLPFLPADEELRPELALREFGLDSLGVVDLLVSLESAYDIRLADDHLCMDTFSTPAVLWNALSEIQVTHRRSEVST
jgi:[acyl-carrier-protein] S-malonyltransferase